MPGPRKAPDEQLAFAYIPSPAQHFTVISATLSATCKTGPIGCDLAEGNKPAYPSGKTCFEFRNVVSTLRKSEGWGSRGRSDSVGEVLRLIDGRA